MNRGTWCTKEDVLKDLEVASGQRVTDVGVDFYVIGEGPPPPRVFNNEDDEIELRFGRAGTLNQGDQPGPDLNGITKMLRMVQEYENLSDGETRIYEDMKDKKIIISKLNPNVKEFIPKNVQKESSHNVTVSNNPSLSSGGDNTKPTKDACIRVEPNEIKFESRGINAIDITKTNVTDIKNREMTKENKKEIAKILKNKISVKKDTFEEKRQTNLAIVNLLKLYAKPEPVAAKPVKPLTLLTPQFFENCKAADFKSNIDNLQTDSFIEQKIASLPKVDEVKNIDLPKGATDGANLKLNSDNKNVFNNDTPLLDKEKNNLAILDKDNIENKQLDEATSLTPNMANATIAEIRPAIVIDRVVDPEIAESITKVNNWLDDKPFSSGIEKENAKGPALYLGPVSYKRKDPATCKSPSEIGDKKISKPSDTAYKPSSYADELLKKYKERSKNSSTHRMNIWEKLEDDLMKKDAEIKNRKK